MPDARNQNGIIESDLLNCTRTNSGAKVPRNCVLDTPTSVWSIINVQRCACAKAPSLIVRAKVCSHCPPMCPPLPPNCTFCSFSLPFLLIINLIRLCPGVSTTTALVEFPIPNTSKGCPTCSNCKCRAVLMRIIFSIRCNVILFLAAICVITRLPKLRMVLCKE